jgi:hypothetical protein
VKDAAMSAARAKKPKTKRPKARRAGKSAARKKWAQKIAKPKRAAPKPRAPESDRPFRFTAADIVKVLFAGNKKPENFRVDDMAEAALVTQDGPTRHYFQYRLVSNDRQQPDGSERCFWFFDPKPVGTAGWIAPVLWRPVDDRTVDGQSAVGSHSGNFSTRSVTSYDGSGACHVVKLNDTPTYRMRLDFNGKREFCESLAVAIGKDDILTVS